MEIWILNHYAKPPTLSGGSRHYDMAKELVKLGHNVTVFSSSFMHSEKKETKSYKSNEVFYPETISDVKFIWIKTREYHNSVNRILNAIDYYRNTKKTISISNFKKPDIIIGSTVHLLAPLLASKLSKKYKSKFYFEERDFWPQTLIDFGKISRYHPLSFILYKFEKQMYIKADKIIVLFDRADQYVMSRGISKDKILYLPNGISRKSIEKDSIVSSIFDQYKDKKIVTYIGSHGEANELGRILDLAEIMRKNNQVKFLFFGEGPLKNKLIKQKSERNLENIEFYDAVPKKNVHYLLTRSDIGIISMKDTPLYKYGFSMNKIYDYLYAGLPLIMIVNQNLAPNFDRDGVFVANNLDNQRKNIMKLVNEDDYYKYHSKKSEEFSSEFMWDKQIIKLTDLFNEQ